MNERVSYTWIRRDRGAVDFYWIRRVFLAAVSLVQTWRLERIEDNSSYHSDTLILAEIQGQDFEDQSDFRVPPVGQSDLRTIFSKI